MTPQGNDPHPDDDADNGVLDDTGRVNTAGIGILGEPTAHVSIDLSAPDDDDLVDDDFAGEYVEDGDLTADIADDEITDAAIDADLAAAAVDAAVEADFAPAVQVDADDEDGTEYVTQEEAAAREDTDPARDEPTQSPAADAPERAEVIDTPAPSAVEPVAAVASAVAARPAREEATVLVSRRIGDVNQVAERETPDLLTADRLLDPSRQKRAEPEGYWRHLMYSLTGHRLNLGDNKRARARKELDRRIAAPLPGGARFVAVVSRKGGVGKTTITALVGQALADAREDRVIAVDANPDRGTLAERIARSSGKTVRDLVREKDRIRGYNDISNIVARDETRLDVLASDTDPRVSLAFSDDEYRAVADVAAHYYSIVLTDTGTGIVHSVMGATLDIADQLIVVAGLSIDEAKLASETLTWLETNGHEDQVRSAIVVLNNSSPGAPLVRQDEVEAHFRSRVRDVVRVPYDPTIATGGAITFRDLQPATRAAARELAAKIVEGLRAPAQAA